LDQEPGTRNRQPPAVLRARWILPIDGPPIAGGWIETAAGRVVRVGAGPPPGPAIDLGDVALLPGLVNAHTHLELSWLAGRVAPASSLVAWIRALLAERAAVPADAGDAVARAVTAMHLGGTALVGDVANTLLARPALEALGIGGVVFHELLGFSAVDPAGLVRVAWERVDTAAHREAGTRHARAADPGRRASVVAHAPYSVSPALFSEIARSRRGAPLSVHLAESYEEIEFLYTGRGPFRELLQQLGVWDPGWQPPGTGPVDYLGRLGYLHAGCLVVHGVHLTPKDVTRLSEAGVVLVVCPRSNAWVGAGLPPITRFYNAGLRVAIGTDSLASVGSLSVLDELAEVRRICPEVEAARILESATRTGAEALGFADFGTIRPGQRAVFTKVAVPADTRDVEEYLVSGPPPGAAALIA
jgi:cytosine/adenosine deaminase-related metal-dependent hydrolase